MGNASVLGDVAGGGVGVGVGRGAAPGELGLGAGALALGAGGVRVGSPWPAGLGGSLPSPKRSVLGGPGSAFAVAWGSAPCPTGCPVDGVVGGG